MSIEITDANFDEVVLKATKPVLVDFWAPWCAPCRALSPVIDELSVDFEGKCIIGKVNIDSNPRITQHYLIRTIPTILFFKKGEYVDKNAGSLPKSVLADKLNSLL